MAANLTVGQLATRAGVSRTWIYELTKMLNMDGQVARVGPNQMRLYTEEQAAAITDSANKPSLKESVSSASTKPSKRSS